MAKRYLFNFKRLDVYGAAVEHFAWSIQTLAKLDRPPFALVSQITGSSLSMMANIAEANGRSKRAGEVEQHYRYAQGSAYECAAYLDAFSALGVIDDHVYNAREEHLSRIAAMLTRLMQKEARRR